MALAFPGGASGYVDITAYSGVQITGDITVCIWARFSTSQALSCVFARWGADEAYGIFLVNNKIDFEIRVSNVSKVATTTGTYNDGAWHHLAGVFNSTNVLVKVDAGVTEDITGAATAGPIDNPSLNLAIGSFVNHTSSYVGDLAHACIFDRALTNAEIKTVMYYGPHKVPGCVLYMPLMIGGTAQTEPNYAPIETKNNGTTGIISSFSTNPPTAPWFASDEPPTSERIVVALTKTASDTLNNWAEGLLVGPGLRIGESLSMSDAIALSQLSNLTLSDTLNNWSDAAPSTNLQIAVNIPPGKGKKSTVSLTEAFSMTDAIALRMHGIKTFSDSLQNWQDAASLVLHMRVLVSESLNNWADAVSTNFANVHSTRTVSDTLNNWADAVETDLQISVPPTTDLQYIRQYLNDVIN